MVTNERKQEIIDNFILLDDDFMSKVFDKDTSAIQCVLRVVLNDPGLKVIRSKAQYMILNTGGRDIWLDVFAESTDGRKMNLEVQRENKDAIPRRARFHSAAMDVDLSKKGIKFKDLPETWVVFLTERDFWKAGKPLYPVERHVEGIDEPFNDGAHILYVNGDYKGDDPVGRLVHDFKCKNSQDMNYPELAERVRYFKESEGRQEMCEAMEKLIAEEVLEKQKENAIEMLKDGVLTDEQIAKYASLSLEQVRELRKSLREPAMA